MAYAQGQGSGAAPAVAGQPPPPANPSGATPATGETPLAPQVPMGAPSAATTQAVISSQPASATDNSGVTQMKEIVVTGTSLKGVAPIGTSVTTIGQDLIKSTGAVSVSQLTNTVPAITTSGSAPQGQNVYSFYSPQIHSLGGSASNSTLVIIDGLRPTGGGTQYSETDPNIIPISAIERVEVLADGASSVYGSDAVAGVVNYITRKSFDGLQVNAQGGWADDYDNVDANFVWGTHNDNTNVVIAGQYTRSSELLNNARSFTRLGNYTSIGGTNLNSFACSPATIRTPASGNNVYLSPSATSTVANVQANAPCNTSIYGAALPEEDRKNLFVRVTHDFTDKFSVSGTFVYNQLHTSAPAAPGTVTGVTVYGPGSGKGGQINPYFVAPAGEPTATQETVTWLDNLTSNAGVTSSEEDVYYGTVVANYNITDRWSATFSDAYGKNTSSLTGSNVFCSACANLALNGTAQTSGNPNTSDISGQNVIALNLPLTTANALNVWAPAGANATAASVLKQLYATNTSNINYNTSNQSKLEVQGPLFKLPAGDVRLAVGGEFYSTQLTQDIVQPDNTGPTTNGSAERIYNFSRNVYSAYSEAIFPLISADMGIPLIRKVDVDLSGRYDKFSDVGSTVNPKFALNWQIFDGLTFRANYSTSFVAPPMAAVGDPSQGYLYASGSVGVASTIFVPVSAYPNVTQVPGCANATTTCELGLSNNQGLRRQLGGGFDNVQPERGEAWSVGVDFTPRFLPGFAANVTLFNNRFVGGVTSPNPNSIVNSAGLHNQLTICPNGCTQAQINTFANTANGVTISGAVPSSVYYLLDQDTGNVLNLDIQGIDSTIGYQFRTERFGSFRVGDSFSYFTKFDQNFGGGPTFSVLNTAGYNTTFPSIQFHSRANVGWTGGPITLDFFINYVGAYRNYSNTSAAPIILNTAGNPIGGGDKVGAQTTVDSHLAYTFQHGWVRGDQLYIDVQNLFNETPPFFNGNTSGILGGANGYDGFVSNPIGRIVSVGMRANF
ncbi:MAG: TonB-dependent receptor [Caulobacteraceae bacterium]